jgi:hypothetical protein
VLSTRNTSDKKDVEKKQILCSVTPPPPFPVNHDVSDVMWKNVV